MEDTLTTGKKFDATELKSRIPGWGADLDPANRPGVPKERPMPGGTGAHWERPEQQEAKIKIHVSIERPGITPVSGTTCPPKGLSGLLRDYAYSLGEDKLRRWMTLLLADRIDVVESMATSLFEGRPDNVFTEMGLPSEFKAGGRLSRPRLVIGAGLIAVGVGAFLALRGALSDDSSTRSASDILERVA